MNRLASLLVGLFCVSSLFGQTFTSTVNQTIPDNNTTTIYTLTVSGLAPFIDTTYGLESVCINILHTRDSDMDVRLEAPNGVIIKLFAGVGGSGDNFTNTCMTGLGTPIASGTAPFTGSYLCQGYLGDVNMGQNPNGVWKLRVKDTAAQRVGTLVDWRLTFSANPAKPFPFYSSNLPIVKLTTLGTPMANDPKVPVRMQIIDNGPGNRNYTNQTNYAFVGTIMAEWQGFTGPTYPKKNYDFELVDSLGFELDTNLLGLPVEHDWIFKAEYLDRTLIKNTITYEMARRMGVYAPRTKACEVLVDGVYSGYYTLTEKIKRDSNRVDIAKLKTTDTAGVDLTGGYIIEMNINGDPAGWNSIYPPINDLTCNYPVEFKFVYPNATTILPVQRNYIHAVVDSFENVLNGPNFAHPDSGYRKFIKVSSFVDFLIVNEFSVNYDSYGRSTFLYKEKATDGGKLKIGPPWDYDRAMDYTLPARTSGWVWEMTHPYWPFPFWWSKLWTEQDYRKQVACRWSMLRENTLSDTAFTTLIDSLYGLVNEAQSRNFVKWNLLGGQTYDVHMDSLRSYMGRRLAWMDLELDSENVAPPVFYLPTDTVVCNATLYDAGFNGTQFDYNWQPGPDTSTIVFTTPGTYGLLVTDQWGCYARKEMDVAISIPDASFSGQQVAQSLDWNFSPTVQNATSYLWDFGDGDTSTSVNPMHSYATDGAYVVTLILTDSIGCQDTSSISIQFVYVGLAGGNEMRGDIYPNPFSSKLQVVLDHPAVEACTIELQNELGQVVIRQEVEAGTQLFTLGTGNIPAGLYALRVKSSDFVLVKKVVKL